MVLVVKKVVQLCTLLALVLPYLDAGVLHAQQELSSNAFEMDASASSARKGKPSSSLSLGKISGPTNEADSLALVALFNTADGIKWTNRDGWLYLAVPSWNGVTVNGAGRVTGLQLPFNELEGEIPFEIGDLSELRTLDFSDNFTRGVNLPETIGNLSKLEVLKLTGIQDLSADIFDLGNLRELVVALISNDQIPEGLGRLSQLRDLNIYTQAQGPLPNDLGNLRNLEKFRFTGRWSGQIPNSFWNMTRLKSIRIRGTQRTLEGELSPLIGNLRDLEVLSITNTNLSGALPREIGNLQNLKTIELSTNKFTSIPNELTRLNRLEDLDLDDNNLSDTIPLDMARFLVEVDNRGDCRLDSNEASFCLPNTSEYRALGRDPICRIQLSNSCTAIVSGPQAPSLSTPDNGATGLSRQAAFSWNASSDAQNYELEISERSDFQSIAFNSGGLTGTTHTIPANTLNYDKQYFWRVRASNNQGESFSESWSFTTISAPVLPGLATLISPSNNSSEQDLPLTFTWQASANADVHLMEVSKQSNFSSRAFESSNINANSHELNSNHLEEGVTYYWRVKGRNSDGDSPWSDVWKFTTMSAPVPPGQVSLISPSDNSAEQDLPLTLSWQASANADVHLLQVSKQSNFSSRAFEASDINDNSRELNESHLEQGVNYYWRVKGRNSDGDSPWSDVWKFTTRSAPVFPVSATLISPRDNSVEQALPLTFSWQSFANANVYLLQVSKQSSFATRVFESPEINGRTFELDDSHLEDGTKYFWRVKGRNDDGDSAWSEVWTFISIQRRYAITFDVGAGGSASVPDTSYVDHGESLAFSITPDEGFVIDDVLVDNVSLGSIDAYTFENVEAEHSVGVSFAAVVDKESEIPADLAAVEIYPNPVRSVLRLNTNGAQIKSLKIYDSLGREAIVIRELSKMKNLDVSSLPVGVYHVEIVSDQGDRSVKTIAKVK